MIVVGEQQTAVASYEVTIEWDAAEVFEHDVVTLLAAPDPGIDGKQLRVSDIRYATERFERVLRCQIDLTDREA